ncbi:hypothetical protein HX005_14165 [Acinetobacter sp. R933-2]|uniref:hypothetical protein n=1 Tax=Acinetobacter sp. R933-2 TaxID=2746728 RepID=UPI002576F033|nr:hypothetical protein [Acinetobacter sp. R933-2]MDM1248531.1 hypothetical protein [Acinetobacter sp. R933-2]
MKIKIILLSFLIFNSMAVLANDENKAYDLNSKLRDAPLSLTVSENNQERIKLYSSISSQFAALSVRKNSAVYSKFKSEIENKCNALKVNNMDSVSSAYCKASLNGTIYFKMPGEQ